MMMRAAALLLCFTLAGCLTNEAGAGGATAGTSPPQQLRRRRAAPQCPRSSGAARLPRRAAPTYRRCPPQQAQDQPPVDPVLEVRQTCWAQGNANNSFKNIEARADWVNKCITDKLKTLQ